MKLTFYLARQLLFIALVLGICFKPESADATSWLDYFRSLLGSAGADAKAAPKVKTTTVKPVATTTTVKPTAISTAKIATTTATVQQASTTSSTGVKTTTTVAPVPATAAAIVQASTTGTTGTTSSVAATTAVASPSTVANPNSVSFMDNVGLWQAPNDVGCDAPVAALQSVNIPYTLNKVTAGDETPLVLTNADGSGMFSMIVICSDRLAYANGTLYPSAFTAAQWAQLDAYQNTFKVRRINLGVWPGPTIGTNWPPASSVASEEQLISLAPQALQLINYTGINPDGAFSTIGLSHNPTTLYTGDVTPGWGTAIPLLKLAPIPGKFDASQNWLGAVITVYPLTGREEMNFFNAFGSWSTTSNVLQHLWIQWGSRNAYPGIRRAYLNIQIDDVFLPSPITVNVSAPGSVHDWDAAGNTEKDFRTIIEDYTIHAAWQKTFNAKLPVGSNFQLELGYNGNGPLDTVADGPSIQTTPVPDLPNSLLFKKPLGSGTNEWPATPTTFNWAQSVFAKDPLYAGFLANPALKGSFHWVSHTFTHMELNNATYQDTFKELQFNVQFATASQFGLDGQSYFAANSMIPPAITGLLNGDALRAIKDNKINVVCGDNTRSELKSTVSPYHPLISTMEQNGYDGMVIIPRFATNIYYNVTDFLEAEYLYNTIYFETEPNYMSWQDIYQAEVTRVTAQLLQLHPDAYMFHQSNLRAHDITTQEPTYFPQGKFSLVMLWAEMIAAEWKKFVTWPLISANMNDMGKVFVDRQNRDTCGATMRKIVTDGYLTAIEVRGGQQACTWPITVPGDVKERTSSAGNGWTYEQLPGEQLTVWVPTTPGSSQVVTLSPPVAWMNKTSLAV